MSLTSWLQSLQTSLLSGRPKNRSHKLPVCGRSAARRSSAQSASWQLAATEELEPRALLTVSALLIGTELNVFTDAADSIGIRANAGGQVEVLANGAVLTTAPMVNASAVTGIVVTGSDADNVIDLRGVTATQFSVLSQVVVQAGDGDDLIFGSLIGSTIHGGDGSDIIIGFDGADSLDGGNGSDILFGQGGNDTLLGGNGSDSILGLSGDDLIRGNDGDDLLAGGVGNDTIDGGDGSDILFGQAGDDSLNGGDGSDGLVGDVGNDILLGGAAEDFLDAGDGNDTVLGQAGADFVDAGLGDDSIDGGAGSDTVFAGDGNDVASGGADNDSLSGEGGNDSLLGGAGNDSIVGSAGNDVLRGQGGNDFLDGSIGADLLDGGDGNDRLMSSSSISTASAALRSAPLVSASTSTAAPRTAQLVAETISSPATSASRPTLTTSTSSLSSSKQPKVTATQSSRNRIEELRTNVSTVGVRFEAATAQLESLLAVALSSDSSINRDSNQATEVSTAPRFEQNVGQTDSSVAFYSRSSTGVLFLTPSEAVYSLNGVGGDGSVVRMNVVGGNPNAEVVGEGLLPGYTNYFVGNDPTQWHSNVPNYERVRYHDVYPGVDLVYKTSTDQQLEYDFELDSGINPNTVSIQFSGVAPLTLNDSGDLILHTSSGNLVQHAPVVYQVRDGVRELVAAHFQLMADDRVGFQVGNYDTTLPLVIDPVVSYFTYLGGSGDEVADQLGGGVAVDSSGMIYVTGQTSSMNFPTTGSARDTMLDGLTDVFISKIDPSVTGPAGLVYSTYIGGNRVGIDVADDEAGIDIDIDSTGGIVVTGRTRSRTFPVTSNAFLTTKPIVSSSDSDNRIGFVTRLTPDGTQLTYSTYFGGRTQDLPNAVAVNQSGHIYIVGRTNVGTNNSSGFPLVNQLPITASGVMGFLSVLDPNASGGSSLLYSTVLGGAVGAFSGIPASEANDVDVDTSGSAYVFGSTNSTDFPITVGAFQTALDGGKDTFITKIDPARSGQSSLLYSTFLGESSDAEIAGAIDVTSGGDVFVAGTALDGLRTSSGAFQPTYHFGPEPLTDGFVGRFRLNGTGTNDRVYLTYLGGTLVDQANDIVADDLGNAYVIGFTTSVTGVLEPFPVIAPLQSVEASRFLTVLNPSGSNASISTRIGPAGRAELSGIKLDGRGGAVIFGTTGLTAWPTEYTTSTANGLQPTFAGGQTDAFVLAIGALAPPTPPTISISDATLSAEGNSGTSQLTFTLRLSQSSSTVVTVDVTTSNGTATAPSDYVALTAVPVTFAVGQTTRTVTVTINGDVTPEANEMFFLTLSNPTGGATISTTAGQATGTIIDDDGAVSVSVNSNPVLVTEGQPGDPVAQVALFTVSLSAVNPQPVTVSLATVDGTAFSSTDFRLDPALNGFVTIPAGATSVTVRVNIVGDSIIEDDETFSLVISNPTGGVFLGNSTGMGVILDDDRLPASADTEGDTLIGGAGNDTITGAYGNDLLNGGDGADFLSGFDGNDTLSGGASNDTLDGGRGNDTLNGQGGNDLVSGGTGDDQIVWNGAGNGNDTVSGASGFDSVVVNGTGASDSLVVGQNAESLLTVATGGATLVVQSDIVNVVINGNGGDDTITVGSVNFASGVVLTVNGGDGNDTLSAAGALLGATRLRINGDAGNDSLMGSANNDTLDGGDGDDLLSGGLGNDSQIGGLGNDVLNGNEGNDSLNGGDGDDTLRGNAGNDLVTSGDGNDSVLGGDGADTVAGDAGADTISGDAGNDSLSGGSGADILTGGEGADTLDGGTLGDSLSGDAGDDLIRGGDGDDSLDGGDGNDTLIGNDGDDLLLGGAGNDGINGGHGNDTLSGQAGKDTLLGSDGADVLLGGADTDTLLGGDGDDTLNGQGGQDLLAGNEGVDTLNDASAVIDEAFVLSASVLAALEA